MPILAEILAIALFALAVSRFAPEPWRGRVLNLLKAWVTVRAFWLLLDHQVKVEPSQIAELHLTGTVTAGTTHVAGWRLIAAQIGLIEAKTFWTFVAASAGIKFVGILSSMARWQVLLRGQAIELPFRHIFGSFLIGRFIGTFLPSTAGLDGYKLYDAARFSGRTVEVTATTAIEKVLGIFGIFLSFLVALPFGIKIFGEQGPLIAAITVPLALGLIGALLVVLWFPGLVQWLLTHLPIPGKTKLEGVVLRISSSAAAYRDKKALVLLALGLSFVVHFTTAAMYYFTALAIGAKGAEFWPIAFGSSIQIFATVVSPFTIAGAGIREAAQYVLLSNQIGAAAAIVSAALGFWAAEALTLAGGLFWWLRPADYRPAWCRVGGVQVDYDEAARAAVSLETDEDRKRRAARPAADVPSLGERIRVAANAGLGAGVVAGLVIGFAEMLVIAREGLAAEHQVIWYGPLVYALLLGLGGLVGGIALGLLPMERREIRGWTASLAWIALGVGPALLIALFRIRRDVFHEQMPPLPVLAGALGIAGLLVLVLFFLGPRLFSGRLGRAFGALPALALAVLVGGGGAIAGSMLYPAKPAPPSPAPVPAALADRPNILLVVIDTLRADALSCYGGPVEAKAICGVAQDGDGTVFAGFAHASWTKPSFASILTSTLPSTHNTMSKTSTLPQDLDLVSELLRKHEYATGGIVSNINLAPSFGFEQGYDEYSYLAPDYLFGAEESSSKLIFYQIGRKLALRLKPGHRVSDYYQDAETVNRHAFDFLDRHRDARFFLLLHYMDPHDPYFAHPYTGEAVARVEAEHPDPAKAARMRELYYGEIRWTDDHFAKLAERLRALDQWDDTLIVITADHGEEFLDHGGWWHGTTLYEEQIGVPLLVKWPKGKPGAPATVAEPVRHNDVAPTLLAAAGAPIPPAMQGKDLATPYASRSAAERMVYAEEDHEGNVLRAIRTEDWKLIEANADNPRGVAPVELYAIDRDRGEKQNLDAGRPEVTAEMRQHAEAQKQLAASQAVESGEQAKISKEECEKLRVLGYVENCDSVN